MKILITGDVSDWNIENFDIEKINRKYIDLIKNSDFVVYNLEGPIVNRFSDEYELQIRGCIIKDFFYKKLMKFTGNIQPVVSSTKKIIELLKINKNTLTTLANNHIKDCGKIGFDETTNSLNKNNIKFVGAGKNNHVASKAFEINKKLFVVNVNLVSSKKYGILFRIYNATTNDYGGAYLSLKKLKELIKKYHNDNKRVLLIIHGGKEMPANKDVLGIDLKLIKNLNSDVAVIHHFHKYIKTDYEKNNIFILGDFIFKRDGCLPVDRDSSLLQIDIQEKAGCELIKFKVNEIYN